MLMEETDLSQGGYTFRSLLSWCHAILSKISGGVFMQMKRKPIVGLIAILIGVLFLSDVIYNLVEASRTHEPFLSFYSNEVLLYVIAVVLLIVFSLLENKRLTLIPVGLILLGDVICVFVDSTMHDALYVFLDALMFAYILIGTVYSGKVDRKVTGRIWFIPAVLYLCLVLYNCIDIYRGLETAYILYWVFGDILTVAAYAVTGYWFLSASPESEE